MLQEVFRIPFFHIPIYGYGMMLVIGFLLAVELAKYLAKRSNLDPELFVNAGLIALFFGVLGARLSHVLENLPIYTDPRRSFAANLWDAINIRSGGLTFYGGFLLATAACVSYAVWKKVPLKIGLDIIAPCLMVGLGIGRIGCFLNGCCYGDRCDLPLAVHFPYFSNAYVEQFQNGEIHPPARLLKSLDDGTKILLSPEELDSPDLKQLAAQQLALGVQPAQLYSAFTGLLLAALLVSYFTLAAGTGRVFALMLMLESPSRFLLEMLRVEPAVIGRGTRCLTALPPMSFSMVLSAALFAAGVILWFAVSASSETTVPSPAAV